MKGKPVIYNCFKQEAAWERGWGSISDPVSPQSCRSREREDVGRPEGGEAGMEKGAPRRDERPVLRKSGGPHCESQLCVTWAKSLGLSGLLSPSSGGDDKTCLILLGSWGAKGR